VRGGGRSIRSLLKTARKGIRTLRPKRNVSSVKTNWKKVAKRLWKYLREGGVLKKERGKLRGYYD